MNRTGPSILSLVLLATCSVHQVRAGFIYSDFSSIAGLTLNGDASKQGNVLRLSNSSFFSSGSAFTTASTGLGNLSSFSAYFQFRISNPAGIFDGDGQGADGIAFVIQTVNSNVGGAGIGIGYQGISPSVAIEFDTYDNSGFGGDPDGNHVAIATDGVLTAPLAVSSEATRFNNGQVWNAWVDYNGASNLLEVRWGISTSRPGSSMLSSVVDVQSVLGQNTAFLGFTSATGSAYNDHDILTWEYRDRFAPIGGTVPEPNSFAFFGLGTMALGFARRRGRAS